MLIYLLESAAELGLGLGEFRKGEMKYLCLFDYNLNVHGIRGYVDMGSFFDFRVMETKRGMGNYMLEVSMNNILRSWFAFDREINVNDYALKYIKEIYHRDDVEKIQISKTSEWYRGYGNEDKEFYVNHFFKLKSPSLDLEPLKEMANHIVKKQKRFKTKGEILAHLYSSGKFRN